MAVRIPRASLTDSHVNTVRTVLRIQAEDLTPAYTREQKIAQSYMNGQPTKEVFFYELDGTDILLPYRFASILLKNQPNFNKIYSLAGFSFTGELRPDQIPIAEEAYGQLMQNGTTILGLPPGSGKTVYGAMLAAKLGLHVTILCHRDFLCDQWAQTFKEFTNANVWIVPDGTNIKKKKNMIDESFIPHVIICMTQRYMNIPLSLRQKIGTLIIDEAHCWCTPSAVSCLLGWEPKYVIAETATPERRDDMHQMIQALCGLEGVFRKRNQQFDIYRLATGFSPEVSQRAGRLDFNAMLKSCVTSGHRNNIILGLIQSNPDRKILCLTRLKEHIDILLPQIKALGEKVDYFAGNKKTYSDSRVLLGTISKIGTGFDEKNACKDFGGQRINMVILMTSIFDRNLLEQNVGRGFRSDDPIVIDLVDDHATFKKHWYERRKWYLETGGMIHEMKVSSDGDIVMGKEYDSSTLTVHRKYTENQHKKINKDKSEDPPDGQITSNQYSQSTLAALVANGAIIKS